MIAGAAKDEPVTGLTRATVGALLVETRAREKWLNLPTVPEAPSLNINTRITSGPEIRATLGTVTFCQLPPVFGTVTGPVLSWPSK